MSLRGLSLSDSFTFLSPVLIWKLNIYPQIMFIHDRCVLSSHSIHSQPHKQAACVVKKVFFPSLPHPSLLFSFPIPYLERNSAGFSCVERADSVIKAHLAIFVWSPSGYICGKPIWLYLCEAHLAICVWSPSGYICVKPIWLHLCEAHLATFVWSPSGYICVKPIWLHLCEAHLATFVWSPPGHLLEAHLAICEKPIWLFVSSPSGYLWVAIWLFLRSPSGYFWEAHLAISEKPI